MNKRHRTLILDTDPDTLITLQQVFEEAEIDATIAWDEMEACQLIESAAFDLILIGHHPPELNAAAILASQPDAYRTGDSNCVGSTRIAHLPWMLDNPLAAARGWCPLTASVQVDVF